MTRFYKLDPAAFLVDRESRDAYLDAAVELDDPELIRIALRNISRGEAMERGAVPAEERLVITTNPVARLAGAVVGHLCK